MSLCLPWRKFNDSEMIHFSHPGQTHKYLLGSKLHLGPILQIEYQTLERFRLYLFKSETKAEVKAMCPILNVVDGAALPAQ